MNLSIKEKTELINALANVMNVVDMLDDEKTYFMASAKAKEIIQTIKVE